MTASRPATSASAHARSGQGSASLRRRRCHNRTAATPECRISPEARPQRPDRLNDSNSMEAALPFGKAQRGNTHQLIGGAPSQPAVLTSNRAMPFPAAISTFSRFRLRGGPCGNSATSGWLRAVQAIFARFGQIADRDLSRRPVAVAMRLERLSSKAARASYISYCRVRLRGSPEGWWPGGSPHI